MRKQSFTIKIKTIRLSEYRSRRAGNGCMVSARRWFYVVKIHYVPEFVIAPRRGTAPERERARCVGRATDTVRDGSIPLVSPGPCALLSLLGADVLSPTGLPDRTTEQMTGRWPKTGRPDEVSVSDAKHPTDVRTPRSTSALISECGRRLLCR